jgi:glycosyltransferase 2 family protein
VTERRATVRRWIILAVKLLIVALLLWLVRGTLQQSWNYLREHPRPMRVEWLALSAGLYLLALLPEGIFWHSALRALGQDVRWFETLRAYYIGHLGKYAPGKAMVVVLRTALIHSHRVNTGIVVASVFLETLTMMAVGACIAVPVLAIHYSHNALFLLAAAGTATAAGLPTLPPVFSRLARMLGVGRSSPGVSEKLAGFDYPTLVRGWCAMALGWIAMGASLWAMLRGLELPADFQHLWYLYTAITAMAVVLGFAAIILPAGAVAREAVFALLLGPLLLGTESAVIVAVALRLTWLVAELAISVILYCAGWVRPKS